MLKSKIWMSALCLGLFVMCSQVQVKAQVVTDALVASASDKDLTSFIASASSMDEATLKKLFKRVFKGLNEQAATKVKKAILLAADSSALSDEKKAAIKSACMDAFAKRMLIIKQPTIGTNSEKSTM